MKISQLTIFVFALFAAFAFSCSPEAVNPTDGSDMGAFSTTTVSNQSSTIHTAPSPGCAMDITGQLAMDYLGTAYPLPGTSFLLANDETDLYIQIKGMPGYGFSEVALEVLDQGMEPQKDVNGIIDVKSFTSQELLASPTSWYMWKIPMSDLKKLQTYVVVANLANNNNPAQSFKVFLNGKPLSNGGGFTLDYQLGLANCANACETWIGAANPCAPINSASACALPSIGSGGDLSPFHCQNGNNPNVKVTVCHVPPGNPANLHDICINESALPAHIIDFKPVGDECMGHHSGCHLGPCDPCGAGSSQSSIDAAAAFVAAHACTGSGGNGNGNGKKKKECFE